MSDSAQSRPAQNPPSSTQGAASRPAGKAGKSGNGKRAVSTGQILAGLLFVLVVIFIVENGDHVRIRFIAGPKVSVPIYLALLIAAVVGALIGSLLRYRRKRHHANG